MPDANLKRLAEACAAAPDRAARRRPLAELRRAARHAHATRAAMEHLALLMPHGAAAAAEWLGGDAGPLPSSLVNLATNLAETDSVPLAPRLAVAGRLLDALPDTDAALDSVLRPLTAGLSDARRLHRLRQLERYAETAPGLSRRIDQLARSTTVRCPRCRITLATGELPDHLWREHALIWDGAAPAETAGELGTAIALAAASNSDDAIAGLDRAFTGSALFFPESPPTDVTQAVASQGLRDPSAVEMLRARAAESGCGVCPNCLGAVPDPVAPPLPSANWGDGRLTAEGYEVAIEPSDWGRRTTIKRPGAAREVVASSSRLPAATRGALIALSAALLGLFGAALAPVNWAILSAGLGGTIALLILSRIGHDPAGATDWEAFDAAWEDLTPGIGRSIGAIRFLTRLTRLSVGVGQADVRGKRVRELAEHAAVLADKGPEYAALFAAARVLAASDGAAMGLERVAAYRLLFAPVWRGEMPARDAELAAELIHTEGVLVPGDENRLGHLLAADAFAAGFTPADLAMLSSLLPELGRLLPGDALQSLHTLRQLDYRKVGQPAWELAAADPRAARERLAATPDLVLDASSSGLDATVTARGLVVNGVPLDRAARLEFGRDKRGWAVRAGGTVAPLDAEPATRVVANLRAAQALAGELLGATAETKLSARGRAAFPIAPDGLPTMRRALGRPLRARRCHHPGGRMTVERIYLTRHAETSDPTRFHGADSDIGLSELGHRQADAAATFYSSMELTAVVSSNMLRARLTAFPISTACQVPHTIESQLHERRIGRLAGQPFDGPNGLWPDTIRAWEAGDIDFSTPGAETYRELQERLIPAFERVAAAHPGGRVLIVAHGIVCKVLLLTLLDGYGPAAWSRLESV